MLGNARCGGPPTPLPSAHSLAAELKIVRYEFLFNPKSCYSAKTRPCKVLKRTYTQIDTLPKPWPPAALNPGEYLTHVVGVTNTNKRVQIASQLRAVGTR